MGREYFGGRCRGCSGEEHEGVGEEASRLQMRFIVNLLSVPKANIKRAARDTGPSSEAGRSNKDSRKHTLTLSHTHTHSHSHTAVQTIKANIEYER